MQEETPAFQDIAAGLAQALEGVQQATLGVCCAGLSLPDAPDLRKWQRQAEAVHLALEAALDAFADRKPAADLVEIGDDGLGRLEWTFGGPAGPSWSFDPDGGELQFAHGAGACYEHLALLADDDEAPAIIAAVVQTVAHALGLPGSEVRRLCDKVASAAPEAS